MKTPMLLLATLLCSALLAFGQTSESTPTPSGQTAGATNASGSGSAGTTIDGCLGGSAGAYTVKDKSSGMIYNLTGVSSNLDQHVGAEVQVTGTAMATPPRENPTASHTATGAGTATGTNSSAQNSFHATSMKKVAPTCQAGQ